MSSHWARFFLAILVGIAAGLLYGWIINPVHYVETTPNTLRVDYKADYVLMTAEAYNAERNLERASRRLAILGSEPPAETVHQAVLFAERAGYTDSDLALMQALDKDLQNYEPARETPAP